MSDASVRTARATDAPAVGAVQAAVWRTAFVDLLDESVLAQFEPTAFAKVWTTSLRQPPSPLHRLLVATEADQVVGFAAIGPTTDPDHRKSEEESTGEILAMGVHPEARRRGHGSRLLNAAVDTLRAGDFTTVLAWLPADDDELRAFAAAAGLTPDGAWRDHVVGADDRTAREVRLVADLREHAD